MNRPEIRIDVQHTSEQFTWVLQATAPVQDLAVCPRSFDTRFEAIADFERVAAVLGWRTYVGVEGAAVIEADEARAAQPSAIKGGEG